jgi:hypothetical protein
MEYLVLHLFRTQTTNTLEQLTGKVITLMLSKAHRVSLRQMALLLPRLAMVVAQRL